MAKEELMETRFHALPIKNNKAFPIDVGDCSIFDVNVNTIGQKFVNTRKVPINQESCITPFGVSLPLTLPKTSYFSSDYHIERTFQYPIHESIRVRLAHQYEWYVKEKLDLQHVGIRDGLGKHNREWKASKQVFSSNRERFQFQNIDRVARKRSRGQVIEREMTVYECCNDIPQKLLLSMLDEACYEDYIDHTENYSLRNCVCAYRDDHVLHTSGPYNNELVLVKLTTDFRLLNCLECDRVDVGEKILEIECLDGMIVVRCYFSIAFYKSVEQENELKLTETNRLSFDTTIHGSAINRFTGDEVAIVDMQSVVVLSLDGQVSHSVENDVGELDEPPKWQNIINSNFIQTYLLSRSSEILMHDFREKPYNLRTFFDLPSEYFNRYELFSPVLSSSPVNCHQYFASTNQSLVVIDDRYLKTPVMKINHYMDSPPRFIQTKKRSQDGCLVALGAFEKDEIVTLNLRCGCTQELSLDKDGDVKFKCKTPMQLDGNSVQFSSPSYWSTKLNDWRLAYKTIKDRLNQPCIGFCINKIEADQDGLYLIQESLPGDLFYQRFSVQRESVKKENRENLRLYKTLSSDGEARCKSWMDSMWEIYKEDKTGQEEPPGSLYLDVHNIEAKLVNDADKSTAEENTDELSHTHDETCKTTATEESVSDNPQSMIKSETRRSIAEHADSECYDNGIEDRNDNQDQSLTSSNDASIDHQSGTQNSIRKYDIAIDEVKSDSGNVPGISGQDSSTCNAPEISDQNSSNRSLGEENVANDDSIGDSTIWRKLLNLRDGNRILTSASLELSPTDDKELKLVPSPETFEKPLSQTLLKNWIEDAYTPLEVFAPNIAYDEENDDGVLNIKSEEAGV